MLAVILALMSGGTIVLNRMLNAEAGTRIGIWPSTLFNYVTGLLTSFALLVGFWAWSAGPMPGEWWLYVGGLLGVVVVMMSSVAAPHMPVFLMTLVVFVSQFVAGMVIDGAMGRGTPVMKVVGAVVVMAGLAVYVLGERN